SFACFTTWLLPGCTCCECWQNPLSPTTSGRWVMKLKTVSVDKLALETGKVVNEARKRPVVVRAPGKAALILRALLEDDTADELLIQSRAFRASIRAARRRRNAGKGISLAEARRQLKV